MFERLVISSVILHRVVPVIWGVLLRKGNWLYHQIYVNSHLDVSLIIPTELARSDRRSVNKSFVSVT